MEKWLNAGMIHRDGKLYFRLSGVSNDGSKEVVISTNTRELHKIGHFYEVDLVANTAKFLNEKDMDTAWSARYASLQAIDEWRAWKAAKDAKKKADIYNFAGLSEIKKKYKNAGKAGKIQILECIKWYLEE